MLKTLTNLNQVAFGVRIEWPLKPELQKVEKIKKVFRLKRCPYQIPGNPWQYLKN